MTFSLIQSTVICTLVIFVSYVVIQGKTFSASIFGHETRGQNDDKFIEKAYGRIVRNLREGEEMVGDFEESGQDPE